MIQNAAMSSVHRPGAFMDVTIDWSTFFQCKPVATGSPSYNTIWVWGDSTYTNPYIWIGYNATNLQLEVFDGSNYFDFNLGPIGFGTALPFAVTYEEASTTVTLFISNVAVGSVVVDLGTITFVETDEYLLGDATGGGGSITTPSAAAYARAWQALLTAGEFVLETASTTAVRTDDLLSDTPLQTSIDLTAHNNTLTQWTAIGTVTTDTDDPLLSVVAGPPTNTSPATATTVTIDSAYFQDVATVGVATTVWFKTTAPSSGSVMLGADAFGDLSVYKPRITVYEGLANANAGTPYLGILGTNNCPIQFPITPGLDYYFKATRNGAVSPSTLQISVLQALHLSAPIGSIGINDDKDLGVMVFLDGTTGYPLRYQPFDPSGEGGCPLSNGRTIVCENSNAKPNIYDADFLVITEVDLANFNAASSNLIDTFLLGLPQVGPTHNLLRLVDQFGVIDPTVFDIGTAGAGLSLRALGLNVAANRAYFALSGANNTAIQVWNLVTNSAEADLVAGVASYASNRDIIGLQDLTILVPRYGTDFIVTRYDTSGVVQSTYTFTGKANIDNRLATAIDDPNSFWCWIKDPANDGFSIFDNVKVSDGSILHTFTQVQYIDGTYEPFLDTNTPIRFGHFESCPFWLARVAIGPLPTQPLRLTQLPLEVAYDYAMLQPFIKGGGLNWVTPPKTLT